MKDKITALIVDVAKDIADENDLDSTQEISAATRLFGEGGLFDSMALVSLVVAVEQSIEEKLGASVTLADEKALSQKSSPYRTVDSLADYAASQIDG
jgi:acyl carrier protein